MSQGGHIILQHSGSSVLLPGPCLAPAVPLPHCSPLAGRMSRSHQSHLGWRSPVEAAARLTPYDSLVLGHCSTSRSPLGSDFSSPTLAESAGEFPESWCRDLRHLMETWSVRALGLTGQTGTPESRTAPNSRPCLILATPVLSFSSPQTWEIKSGAVSSYISKPELGHASQAATPHPHPSPGLSLWDTLLAITPSQQSPLELTLLPGEPQLADGCPRP